MKRLGIIHWLGLAVLSLGGVFVLGGLAWLGLQRTQPPPVNAPRVAERKQALAQTRAAETQALHRYGWVDPARQVVQLPIQRAMELVVQEWTNPAQAQSNLAARAARAHAPAPKPPPEPNPYE